MTMTNEQINQVRGALYGDVQKLLAYYEQQEVQLKAELESLDLKRELVQRDLTLNVLNISRANFIINQREAELQEELKLLETLTQNG